MTQPLDRNARHEQLGPLDEESGEFWVENPFDMAQQGMNLSSYERNRVYLNLDGHDFVEASFASRADLDADSRAVIAADFDRDGAPDLLVSSVGGGPVRLFRNTAPRQGRFVRIELEGTESNRRGIGARLVLEAGGRTIRRDLFPVNPGMGQGPAELSIGVGAVEKIDRLTVTWPTGKTQQFTDLPVDARLVIEEGNETFRPFGLSPSATVASATPGK